MLLSWLRTLAQRLKRGGPLLLVMLVILLVGFFLGFSAPQEMDAEAAARTRNVVGNYIQALPEAGVSAGAESAQAFLLNGGMVLAIGLAGLHLLGLPLIAAIVFLKGLSLGYAMSFLLDYQGASGFVIILLSMLPQHLLLLPVFVLAAALAAYFSLSLYRSQHALGQSLAVYGARFVVLLGATAAAAFIQGYLCPLLLKLFFIII